MGRMGKKGMGGGVHGRATRARSIKRAFTIDQRSIEVDHELKTVVTREARRPRQLFARLCKYLATERGGWAPSWSVPSSTREYHTEEGGCNNTRGGPPPPIFSLPSMECGPSHRANFQRIIAPCEPCRDQGCPIDGVAHDGSTDYSGSPSATIDSLDLTIVDTAIRRVECFRIVFSCIVHGSGVRSRMHVFEVMFRSRNKRNEEQARLYARREN